MTLDNAPDTAAAPFNPGIAEDLGPKQYTRMPGGYNPRVGLFNVVTERTYLAPDHLLISTVSRYNERNRKVFFKDIQSVSMRSNSEQLFALVAYFLSTVWLIVTGILFEVNVEDSNGVIIIIAGILALFPMIKLITTAIGGPTCTFRIATGVQAIELRSVTRIRTAERYLARLLPGLQHAQGGVNPQLPQMGLRHAPRAAAHAEEGQPPLQGGSLIPHRITIAIFLILGVSLMSDLFIYNDLKNTMDAFLAFGVFIPLIWAVISQQSRSMFPAFRRFIPNAITINVVELFASFSLALGWVANSGAAIGPWIRDDPMMRALSISSSALMFMLGGYGLLLLREHTREIKDAARRAELIAYESAGGGP